ncbi:amino acid transporter [Xylariaceae sp. FL1651]|nr:amino acid transporter [Xylariaceae sp. FL1651]
MHSTAFITFLALLSTSNGVGASPLAGRTCKTKTQRKVWEELTEAEKTAYINADLCLMAAPPAAGIPGAQNLWDELAYTHGIQSDYIRSVWNEPADVGALPQAAIFNAVVGYGGDGSDSNGCITDGPFVNTVLHIKEDLSTGDFCLSRAFNETYFNLAVQTNVDMCMEMATFTGVSDCLGGNPLAAGHAGVGGVMRDLKVSPGDPLFYHHHAWIDKLWWDWQTQKLPARLTEIGGNNTVAGRPVDPNLINYFNDGGSITTLNHVLWSHNLVPNATIADVMDLGGDYVCAEYV